VPAKENGGNAFADPSNGQPPADKVVARAPPPAPPLEPAQWITDVVDRSPPYPPAALRNGIAGQVLLRVCVAATGNVESVTVLKKLGFGCDEAAVEWAKKRWRFKPARRGGEPVPTCMLQPMRFRLEHQ
jgi:periplasmic protein TonB